MKGLSQSVLLFLVAVLSFCVFFGSIRVDLRPVVCSDAGPMILTLDTCKPTQPVLIAPGTPIARPATHAPLLDLLEHGNISLVAQKALHELNFAPETPPPEQLA
jgi:hypothetical protein